MADDDNVKSWPSQDAEGRFVLSCTKRIKMPGQRSVGVLVADKEVADFFEAVTERCGNAKAASNWIMTEVLRARDLLEARGIATDVWSVTSYNELNREALRCERENMLAGPGGSLREPFVRSLLDGETGVFVAASDYMKSLPLSIARWIPGPYVVLGTDGYGLSESRPDLRDWFEVSGEYIAYAALSALAEHGAVSAHEVAQAVSDLGIWRDKPDPALSGPAQVRDLQ